MNSQKNKENSKRTIIVFLRVVLKEIKAQRKWVLLPLWIILVVIGLVLIFAGSSYLLPAIYIAI